MSALQWIRLLAAVWAAAQCGVVQGGPAPDPGTSLSDTVHQIQAAVDLISVHVQIADLASRLTSIEARQQTQTAELASRLTSIEARQQTQTAELASRLTSIEAMHGPADCTDLPAASTSGIYMLQPSPHVSLPAFCDLDADGGGWIVIQRRADIQPRQNFDLGWQEYEQGFGELAAEFWWGLQNLWTTTSLSGHRYQLRIDLGDWSGEKRYAVYQTFTVSSESDGYQLTVSGYSGDAGDDLSYYIGRRFSTRDRDQDKWSVGSCAADYKGGWWYTSCGGAYLNGPYLAQQTGKYREGIIWYGWKGASYSLKTVEMKIRPAVES